MKKYLLTSLFVFTTFFCMSQFSNSADFAAVIKERQDGFQTAKDQMKPLVKLIKGEGSKQEIQQRAETLAKVFARGPELFPEGSSEGTDALPEIWGSFDEFNGIFADAEKASNDLAKLAADDAGYGELMGAFGQIGKNCKACHQLFRK